MANTFSNTTAEKAIAKIVERIVEEVDNLEDTVRGAGGTFTADDYDSISMCADDVKQWADNLLNFSAVCEFGEATDADLEKFVPIDYVKEV